MPSSHSLSNLVLMEESYAQLDINEDDMDFCSDIYTLAERSHEELFASWRIFTALKDENYQSRRLENAAWRMQGMHKIGKTPSPDIAFSMTGESDIRLPRQNSTISIPDEVPETATSLLGLALEHGWSDDCLQEVLAVLQSKGFQADELPEFAGELRILKHQARSTCAVFTHSLERNGANNFCLYLVRLLKGSQGFVVFSPKEGPMRADFEQLGLKVIIVDTTSVTFLPDLAQALQQQQVGVIVANTIMRCDVVLLAAEKHIPSIWVIHESWPQDQLDHYAKEVFMCKDIDAQIIRRAFAAAGTIVFPSNMQGHLYDGMFKPGAGITIYNGIPLQQLDSFQKTHDRRKVRAMLGYKDNDFLVLHIGTVCSRKGQLYSARACCQLISSGKCKDLKLLIVGARYIRDHEIKYIDQVRQVAESSGVSCKRFEDCKQEELGEAQVTIMDIQAEVLRFYMAADVIVVPSLNEVLPLVVCEGMAFERPVVCSRIDAIPEALDDGVEGFLIPAADSEALSSAVLKLRNSPELRRSMGKAGRARVLKQFSYHTMGKRYRELLDTNIASLAAAPLAISSHALAPVPQKLQASESVPESKLLGRIVLVDMDNTMVDWDGEFIRRFAQVSGQPESDVAKLVRSRRHFEIEENFEASDRQSVLSVVASAGLYESLQPLPGALDALRAMVQLGADVRLVTSPHPTCPGPCALEKYSFVRKHLGDSWIERLIITRDKTLVHGDLLVDDKPKITGTFSLGQNRPTPWTHVLFSQPYNEAVQEKPRLSKWSDWQSVLTSALSVH